MYYWRAVCQPLQPAPWDSVIEWQQGKWLSFKQHIFLPWHYHKCIGHFLKQAYSGYCHLLSILYKNKDVVLLGGCSPCSAIVGGSWLFSDVSSWHLKLYCLEISSSLSLKHTKKLVIMSFLIPGIFSGQAPMFTLHRGVSVIQDVKSGHAVESYLIERTQPFLPDFLF